MISSLTGKVKQISTSNLVVDISGVGISVNVPARVAAQSNLGSAVELHTYLVVREDALTLYGFLDLIDRNFFELLLSVTGIGPKVAQAILSINDAAGVADAISTGDLKTLESIPGLGKKGAQRLVLELKEKVSLYLQHESKSANLISNQVEVALQGLGYSVKESKEVTSQIRKQIDENNLDISQAIKLALQFSGSGKK
jgi:Holliday junction DNA helicase RuvA